MAIGRIHRVDNRRSPSCCSNATLVVFVALCLVGVWMMTSSTVVPVEMPASGKSKVAETVSDGLSKHFEGKSGDVPEDKSQGDTKSSGEATARKSNNEASDDQAAPENSEDNSSDSIKGEKDDSVGESKPQTYSDVSGTGEGGEVAKTAEGVLAEGGSTESRKNGQNISTEQSLTEARNTEKGINKEKDADQEESSEQNNDSEQSSDESATESQTDQSNNKNSEETAGDEDQPGNEEKSNDASSSVQKQSDNKNVGEEKSEDDADAVQAEKEEGLIKEEAGQNHEKEVEKANVENKTEPQAKDRAVDDILPDEAQSDLLNETNTQNGAWSTQSAESKNQKELQASSSSKGQYNWKLCNVTAGEDYIPCLDNEEAIKKLRSTKHYEHRERHCPKEGPTCLVPCPKGYRKPIEWPNSREKVWYYNVPHTKLAVVKGHQNWVKVSGEHLIFPGGGTQFKNGALHYIDFIQESLPDIAWGKQSRVVLDVGCGVASFGGYLFDRDTLTMSFAPKDEHEAQVQFALERGIPAISAVMGTKRLPFPSKVFDVIHCARCRVPWHIEGGMLLLELNRLLRPDGYFVWSATPVYRALKEEQEIWNATFALTKSLCWEMVTKTRDALNEVGFAIFRKPSNNACYDTRSQNSPPLCQESDDPNAAWNIQLQACIHKLPVDPTLRGSHWPDKWPQRLETPPYWLNSSHVGVYGKPGPEDFRDDYNHWKKVVSKSYINGMGINWSNVRNVMDMRSVYGGFAAALRDMKVWVMNVVSIDSPDTLPVIFERGLFGIYHDWCESFSTYPRTYDLLHADHLFSRIKKRCDILPVFVEVDRILRPEGYLIVRDTKETINELELIARSLKWEIRITYMKEGEGLLCVQKTMWRPKAAEANIASTS
ncbi:probable methyltransferase PMT24 [Phalaenopsis equestris]|uniref:probable methyltransferase PMT24 n=1 Tax=Phalaenopsis equestris TaxID=78828 RepID=UPI0009E2F200|nr:probable methyltransferase PMT24 [Phalaenopsis equestris]XP_020571525.1 probable methyltransferase PMT24 [Phalaenopsis equestris]